VLLHCLLNGLPGLQPVLQGDGTQGYNVTVTASPDNRQVTVGYEGTVVRGINTVKVAANLSQFRRRKGGVILAWLKGLTAVDLGISFEARS
jgi:hypothetical protein